LNSGTAMAGSARVTSTAEIRRVKKLPHEVAASLNTIPELQLET